MTVLLIVLGIAAGALVIFGHRIFGLTEHEPGNSHKCVRCGHKLDYDSQGNWFSLESLSSWCKWSK